MAFHLTHRYGSVDPGDSSWDFAALLRELEDRPADTEHGSVAVTHESEWSVSVSRGGHVTFENLETGGERHMDGVAASKILELWRYVADGNIAAVEKEPWLPRY